MKKILMSMALIITLVSLTGCGSSKTLTCTETSSDNGFSTEKVVYEFKKDKIIKATETASITAEGDFAQYIDDYKKSAQTTVDGYNKVNGISAKVEADNNTVSVVAEIDPSKMSESEFSARSMGETYDSMKAKLTEKGYTCK